MNGVCTIIIGEHSKIIKKEKKKVHNTMFRFGWLHEMKEPLQLFYGTGCNFFLMHAK